MHISQAFATRSPEGSEGPDAGRASRRRPARGRASAALTAAVALALVLTGCGGGGGGDSAPKSAGSTADADRVEPLAAPPAPKLPVTVDSADGTEVTIGSTDRIVPLTGSLSEIVFTLGFGKQVVARDITATFEQAEKLPVVTRAHDVSAESVLSLKPTIVLADTTTGPAEAIDQIRDAGIPLLVVEPAKELADVGRRIDTVAEALGVPSAGTELKERTESRIAAVQKSIPDHKGGEKPRSPSSTCAARPPSICWAARSPGPVRCWRRRARSTPARSRGWTRTSPPSPARRSPRPRRTRSS